MSTNLSPVGGAAAQFLDNNGNPLSGGKIYTYEAGTTTPEPTYTTGTGAVAHSNPIILDSAGRVPGGQIWVNASQDYKFVLTTSADVTIATYDDLMGINGTGLATNAVNVAYDPAGLGAVQTTVQAKLRETVSVKDFGAVGDGVTDDTAAIQAAIDYSKSTPNIKCVEFPTGNYAINSPIFIHGDFNFGLVIEGNKSTITSSHNGVAFSGNSAIPSPAPTFNIHLTINNLTIVGPGIGNLLSVGVSLYGASYSLNNVYITAFFLGLQGAGCLISEFNSCTLTGNNIGSNFTLFDGFAPNDNHFYKCSWTYNNRAILFGDFPYGSVTFIGCQIEANNISGNATDGISVCDFANAGEVTFIGSHFESNPGQYNLIYDSIDGRHLNIIGCKIIPGDSSGAALYMGYGELYVNGSHVTQAVGQNIFLGVNNGGAVIIGDTGGTINGSLGKLVTIRQGRIATGGVNIGSSLAGVGAKGLSGVGAALEGRLDFYNSSGTRLGYINQNNIVLDTSAAYTITTGIGSVIATRTAGAGFSPGANNTQSLGEAALLWSQLYAGTNVINTSDERLKQQVEPIPQSWLDAWGDVDYVRFKFNDSVKNKGDGARWHIGLIAQRVKAAFEARGIDPFSIGLLCFDKWDDIEIEKQVQDENGNPIIDEKTKEPIMQKQIIRVAGEQYGIRYEQALAIECAYLRSKLNGGMFDA